MSVNITQCVRAALCPDTYREIRFWVGEGPSPLPDVYGDAAWVPWVLQRIPHVRAGCIYYAIERLAPLRDSDVPPTVYWLEWSNKRQRFDAFDAVTVPGALRLGYRDRINVSRELECLFPAPLFCPVRWIVKGDSTQPVCDVFTDSFYDLATLATQMHRAATDERPPNTVQIVYYVQSPRAISFWFYDAEHVVAEDKCAVRISV